jgi:hypothetical protein
LLEVYSRGEELVGESELQSWTEEQVLEVGNLWAQSKRALAGVSGNQPFDYKLNSERLSDTLDSASNSLKNITSKANDAKKRLKDRL